VALAFDGLDLDKVIPWVKLSTGLELQADQLRAFAASLEGMGYLENEAGSATAAGAEGTRQLEVASPESEPPSAAAPELSRNVAEQAVAAYAVAELSPAKTSEVQDQSEEEASPEPAPSKAEPSPPPAEPNPPQVETLSPQAESIPAQAETLSPPADSDLELAEPDSPPADPIPPPVESIPPLDDLRPDLVEPRPDADAAEPRAEVIAVAATPSQTGVEPEADPPANVATDSTAFPVLAAPAVAPAGAVAPASISPPWSTPTPLMTPVPVTFGPILEQSSSRRRLRRSLVLFGSLGILAAAAVLALALPFLFSPQERQPPRVRALAVAPGTIFRYFDGAGVIQAGPAATLKFPAPGKVTRMASVGSPVAVGDVAAAVEIARPLQEQLTRQRERLAFYQQMAEAMHQVGNTKEEELQVAKVELRNARIAKTLRALADVAVVASAPGEVEETFAREGEMVEAGHPALRLRSAGFRATFELPRHQVELARWLGFCQVEVEGYVFDCTQLEEGADETHAGVEVASLPASLLGKAAHLARARFEGAFAVPLAAIVRTGARDEVFVVSPQSRAELRPVTVAERDATESIVVQGLDVGDHVVVEVVPGLRAGAQVTMVP
jgi:hypothetical protein